MELYSIFLIVTLQFFPAQSAAQSKLRSNQPTTNPILTWTPEPESLRLPIRPGPVPTYGRAAARTSAAAAGPTSPRSLRPAIPARPSPGDGGQQWGRGRARALHLQELQAAVRPDGEPPLSLPLPHRPLRR